MKTILSLIFRCGLPLGLISGGAYLVYPPAALIIPGALLWIDFTLWGYVNLKDKNP